MGPLKEVVLGEEFFNTGMLLFNIGQLFYFVSNVRIII